MIRKEFGKVNSRRAGRIAVRIITLLMAILFLGIGLVAGGCTDGTGVAQTTEPVTEPVTEPEPCPLSFGGVGADSFTIAAKSTGWSAVRMLNDAIKAKWGFELPVIYVSDYSNGNAIFVGASSPDGSRDINLASYEYSLSSLGEAGTDTYSIIIDCVNSNAYDAVADFLARYITPAVPVADAVYDVTPTDTVGCTFKSGKISLVSLDDRRVLAPGVVYRKMNLKLADGQPLDFYSVSVKSGCGALGVSCPADKAGDVGFATVPDQLAAEIAKGARSDGKVPLAAFNAGFFSWTIGATGLCVKDGVMIHGVAERSWFGVTTDGRPVCGESVDYRSYSGRIAQAANGSNFILKNGTRYGMSLTNDFEAGREPRTGAGRDTGGNMYFAVADGRRPGESVGATLPELSELMHALGASDAVNMDGGGSSTVALVKDTDGKGNSTAKPEIEIVNEPTDGAPRTVFDVFVIYG